MRTASKPKQRGKPSPFGTTERSRRVTATLGPKPNSMTWAQYHAAARRAPWSLDALRAARRDAEPRRLDAPGPLTATERRSVERAHNKLAAGTISGEEYLGILRPLCRPAPLAKGSNR